MCIRDRPRPARDAQGHAEEGQALPVSLHGAGPRSARDEGHGHRPVSEPETDDEEELLLPITETPADEAHVEPDDVADDWLQQPDFDPAGRPL